MCNREPRARWRGVALIAITYTYFLIFAQFSFLSRLADLGIAGDALKLVMAAMASGGILLSLLTPRVVWFASPVLRLRAGFTLLGTVALLSTLSLNHAGAVATAALIGTGLGLVTVTLVTHLRHWMGLQHGILLVGIGTGISYFACNIPVVFTATSVQQAWLASLLCVAGLVVTLRLPEAHGEEGRAGVPQILFPTALLGFVALVWLDSAAFYIIQHTPALKADTWLGTTHLWTNAVLHCAGAVGAALLLERGRATWVLVGAFSALGFACWLLVHPEFVASASLLYPLGVSFYSVALVAYPSFLTSAVTNAQRAREAGWIYAIAGWVGSALGIGMGQNLGHVPPAFIAAAGTVVLVPFLFHLRGTRGREIVVLCAGMAVAFLLYRLAPTKAGTQSMTQIERGRAVYISEGCIHCHSQYVRPNTQDVMMWGPVLSMQQVHAQRPPLIGNRRQGPDLTQIGARRSPLWLEMHMVAPAELNEGTVMPSYAFLFRDERGTDLVTYLASLRGPATEQHMAAHLSWRPSQEAVETADVVEGERLYRRLCATCHEANGIIHQQWKANFRNAPTDLFASPLRSIPNGDSAADAVGRLAQITKFGIPGTDMPGHEYLSDPQIASLSLWLYLHRTQPVPPT